MRTAIQRLTRGSERLYQHSAFLGREPPSDHDHAVFILIHVQRAAPVTLRGLAYLGDAVNTSPAADDPLHLASAAGPTDREQAVLSVCGRDARQRADLSVGQLPTIERGPASRGSWPSARATRTRSRAAPRSMPARQASQ